MIVGIDWWTEIKSSLIGKNGSVSFSLGGEAYLTKFLLEPFGFDESETPVFFNSIIFLKDVCKMLN